VNESYLLPELFISSSNPQNHCCAQSHELFARFIYYFVHLGELKASTVLEFQLPQKTGLNQWKWCWTCA